MKRQPEFSKNSPSFPRRMRIERGFRPFSLRSIHAIVVLSLLLGNVGISPASTLAADAADSGQQVLPTNRLASPADQGRFSDDVATAEFEEVQIPASEFADTASHSEFQTEEVDTTTEIKSELHKRQPQRQGQHPAAAPVDALWASSAITLTVTSDPSFITPGGRVNLSWQIAGLDDFSEETSLMFTLPAGFSPLNNSYGPYDPQTGQLIIPVTAKSGNAIIVREQGVEAGVFTIRAVLEQELVQLAAASLRLESLVIIPPAGGEATGLGGSVRLIIPAGASNEAIAIRIRTPDGSSPIQYSLSGNPFEIIANAQRSGQTVRQFQQPLTIQIGYDEENLWGEELGLTLFYFDEEMRAWRPLPTHVDPENNLLSAQTNHLTNFDIDIQSWQSSRLPTVDGFQVSDFTGAATYSYPIWTPPGPGGLQPTLSLNYNSQVVDSASFHTQASWVGMGWSLDTGYIERDIHATNDDTSDDTYSLILNGASYLLIPGTDGYYHTSDESFMRIERHTASGADHWIVRDGSGNQYVFGDVANSRATYPVFYGVNPCDYDGHRTWRWSLREVRNIFGQELTYTYDNQTKTVDYRDCKHRRQDTTVAVYPEYINYSNNRYRIWFERVDDRTDYEIAWATDSYSLAFYQTKRLASIQIQHDANGDGIFEQVIRKYAFTYASSGHIFPNYTWEAGGKTLTLAKIQEYGLNNDRLPATTFTYDGMHLKNAYNGYGGRVEFVYESAPWFELDAADTRKIEQDFGAWQEPCEHNDGNTGGWYASTESDSVTCQGHQLIVEGQARKQLPVYLRQAGGKYGAYAMVVQGTSNATTAQLGLSDWISVQYLPEPAASINGAEVTIDQKFTQTIGAYGANLYIKCEPYACGLNEYTLTHLPARYRVTQKKIYDGINATPQIFSYSYDGAATNDPAHSTAAKNYDFPDNLYTPEFSEFRGHDMVEETGPGANPLVTTTWFHQDDDKKGRPHTVIAGTRKFTEKFESPPDTGQWTLTHKDTYQTVERVEGDNALKTHNPNNEWNVQLTRPSGTLSNDDSILTQFRMSGYSSGLATQTIIAADSGTLGTSSYRRWGLWVKNDKSMIIQFIYNYANGVYSTVEYPLGMSVEEDTWYQLMLVLDNEYLYARVWKRDDPSTGRSVELASPQNITNGTQWYLKQWTRHGTVWLDEYAEGRIFSDDITLYNPNPQSDAPVDKSGFANFYDIAIAWTRVNTDVNLNFEGDGDFAATATFYKYETAYQNNGQYGNVTHEVDSRWNGSSFADYRATVTRYYPNAGVYLVGLPGWTNQYKCPSGTNGSCSTTAAADLMASSIFVYDEHGYDYSIAPTAGKLTNQRTFKRYTNPAAFSGPKYSDEAFGYDAWGNPTTVTRYTGEGSATAFATAGAQTTNTCYGQENPGAGGSCVDDGYRAYPGWVKDAKGFVTRMQYDKALGVVKKETDPNGAITEAQYDNFGRLTKAARHGDTLTTPTFQFVYSDVNVDALPAPFQVEQSQKTSHAQRYTIRNFYNGLGQAIQIQEVGAKVDGADKDTIVDLSYDGYGRETKRSVTYAVAMGSGYRTPASQPCTKTVYDPLGRTVEVSMMNASNGLVNVLEKYEYVDLQVLFTDANQSKQASPLKTVTTYDDWGRVTRIDPPTTDPWVTYKYDVLGRITEVNYRGAITNGIEYDYLGNRTSQTDPDMGQWSYEYDALGNLTKQTDARGCTTIVAYDTLNRPTSKTYGGTGCPATSNVTYGYDDTLNGNFGIGQRTSVAAGTVTKSWKYDILGHMVEELLQIGTDKLLTKWSYNTADQLLSMTYPGDLAGGSGEKVNYTYLRQNEVYDARNSDATPQVYVNSSTYDAAGRFASRVVGPNRFTTTYSYYPWTSVDGLGRLQKITAGSYQDLRFTYDANGNVLTIQDWKAGGPQTQTFTYDAHNRVTTGVAAGGTGGTGDFAAETYSYDVRGRLTKIGSPTNGYGTLHAECTEGSVTPYHAVTESGAWRYCYDQNGNQTKRVKTSAPTASYDLTYDVNNRLVSVSGSASETYAYDGDGNLVKQVDASGTTIYVGNHFEVFVPSTPVPTSTPTKTPTPTSTFAVVTWTPEVTDIGAPTNTNTPLPTATSTPLPTATNTPLPTATSTPLPTATDTPVPTATPTPVTSITEVRISASADDAEESVAGVIDLSSSDLELVRDDGQDQTIGLRFTNLQIPPGASITSAYIQFKVNETDSEAASLSFQGEASDNAAAFSSASGDVFYRPRTWASTSWSPPAWTMVGEVGLDQRTPDLVPVIQEIINRPGWASGNALAIIVTGSGKRVAESYNGDAAGAPLLHVEYSVDGGPGTPTPTPTATPDPTVEVQVDADTDDAQELNSSGAVDLTGGDLDLVYDNGENHTVGMRFTRLQIPAGATITSAYIQFMANETDSEAVSLALQGEAADNAQTFAATTGNISSRPRTSASVSWSPPAWSTIGEAGPDQQTPDISAIIQEIVDRPGWASGNALAIIVTGSGDRTAESYDGYPIGAPRLHVEYSLAGGSSSAALPATAYGEPAAASGAMLLGLERLYAWLLEQLAGLRAWFMPSTEVAQAAPPPGVVFCSYYYAGGQRVAMRVEGEADPAKNGLFYLFGDHLSSTTVTLKDTGSLSKVGELRYKPWGANRASGYAETLTPTDKRFTGQRWEGGTGLYHYGARWYDPMTGRFTQPDTIVPSQQGVQAWDRFAYGLNNPVKYIDPSGHVACADDECRIVEHPISGKLIFRAGNAKPTFNLGNNKGGNSANREKYEENKIGVNFEFGKPQLSMYNTSRFEADEDNSPNPDPLLLIVIGIPFTSASLMAEGAILYSEVVVLPSAGFAPIIGIPVELTLTVTGLAILDVNIAYWAYIARVIDEPDKEQTIELLPPWGFDE